jgi:hypothetical protein
MSGLQILFPLMNEIRNSSASAGKSRIDTELGKEGGKSVIMYAHGPFTHPHTHTQSRLVSCRSHMCNRQCLTRVPTGWCTTRATPRRSSGTKHKFWPSRALYR